MKQKGFTLIELLAVIVVLALIAIIAIPILKNVIDTAKFGSVKNSVYGVEKAASVYYAQHYVDGITGKYNLDNTTISYKGKIDRGVVYYGDNKKTTILIFVGKYCGYKYQSNEPEIGTVENDKCIIDDKEVEEETLTKVDIPEEQTNDVKFILKVGDYINYSTVELPNVVISSSYNGYSNQSITPSTYTGKWQVLKNSDGIIEIISSSSTATITLNGYNGYRYFIKVLNDASNAYVNSLYAISGRSLGADSASVEDIGGYVYRIPSSCYIRPYHESIVNDLTNLTENNMINIGVNYWYANRLLYCDNTTWNENYGGVKYINSTGVFSEYHYQNGLWHNYSKNTTITSLGAKSAGVRPVLSLKTDLKIESGEGTELSPYILST